MTVKEDIDGGFGKRNEETASAWCREHAKEHDSPSALAERCAETFDFYLEETGRLPEKLCEIARVAIEDDLGDGFGRYMSGILNEEHTRTRRANAGVEHESSGQRRARKIQELPQNRIRVEGRRS